ncbi:MAG: hypothetical protein SOT34_05390, partial [Candidatus Borkfalkiaceae bacterium]|nr:hypothetical protein [Christensenellaceae bacterium]
MNYRKYIAERLTVEGMTKDEIESAVVVPPNNALGDYAFPCFRLASVMRRSPALIAADLASAYPVDGVIASAKAEGGYLNFKVNRKGLTEETLK